MNNIVYRVEFIGDYLEVLKIVGLIPPEGSIRYMVCQLDYSGSG